VRRRNSDARMQGVVSSEIPPVPMDDDHIHIRRAPGRLAGDVTSSFIKTADTS